MEDFGYGMEIEWKKIASMEYGKIVFHSVPCPGFYTTLFKARHKLATKILGIFYGYCVGKHIELI